MFDFRDPEKQKFYDLVASVDTRGLYLLWNLGTGELVQIFSTQANAAYMLLPSDPHKLFMAYTLNKETIFEVMEPSSRQSVKRISKIVLDNDYISPTAYPTIYTKKTDRIYSKHNSIERRCYYVP